MRPVRSAEGMKINWINYHTGVKNIHFRMDADNIWQRQSILKLTPRTEIQELYFERFLELKELLHTTLDEEWQWQLRVPVDGKILQG